MRLSRAQVLYQLQIMLDQYQTGNKKLDQRIRMSLVSDPAKPNLLIRKIEEMGFDTEEKQNKYGVNLKELRTYKDGTLFASTNEMNRWDDLLKIQQVGEICDLRKQVPFKLQSGFLSKQYGEVKPITYVADFVYVNLSFRKGPPGESWKGRLIIEDSKGGVRTEAYKIKRKMLLYKYSKYLFFEV